jgi:hypothetical protein
MMNEMKYYVWLEDRRGCGCDLFEGKYNPIT